MRITCNRATLKDVLKPLSKVVPGRPTHPILSNILITGESDLITLTASDLSTEMTISFEESVKQDGTITVSGKLFSDVISKLSCENLAINVEEDVVTIVSDSGQYRIKGLPSEEFPVMAEIASEEKIVVDAGLLQDGFKRVLFCTSQDDTKGILTGVNISYKSASDYLEFAATDGHQLAVAKLPLGGNTSISGDFNLTIRNSAITQLQSLITDHAESAEIQVGSEDIEFKLFRKKLRTRRLIGSYPSYNALIPKQFAYNLQIDRRQLLSACELVSVLADDKQTILHFDIEPNTVAISTENAELGTGREILEIQGEAPEPLKVAFNGKYLIAGLRAIQEDTVTISLNNATSPVVIKPHDLNADMIYLIMPIQVRS